MYWIGYLRGELPSNLTFTASDKAAVAVNKKASRSTKASFRPGLLLSTIASLSSWISSSSFKINCNSLSFIEALAAELVEKGLIDWVGARSLAPVKLPLYCSIDESEIASAVCIQTPWDNLVA